MPRPGLRPATDLGGVGGRAVIALGAAAYGLRKALTRT
jgi:hypothetical protein